MLKVTDEIGIRCTNSLRLAQKCLHANLTQPAKWGDITASVLIVPLILLKLHVSSRFLFKWFCYMAADGPFSSNLTDALRKIKLAINLSIF